MDTYECNVTKLDIREFARKRVPGELKWKILEAARMTGSTMNTQHWRFVLIQDRSNLEKLAADSTTGNWVEKADFAIIILINPKVLGSRIDGGRVLQAMELAAWNFGIASGLYTGFKEGDLLRDFALPSDLKVDAILGFGYPRNKILGKKDRKPLEELAYLERYGNPIKAGELD